MQKVTVRSDESFRPSLEQQLMLPNGDKFTMHKVLPTFFMIRIAFCVLLGLVVIGCATERRAVRIVATGSHVPKTDSPKPTESLRWVVWGNHPGMVGWLVQRIIAEGQIVVERARIKEVLNEQKIILTNTADDEADILRVGKLLGATNILFAEATIRPEAKHGTVVTPAFGGASYSGTVYHMSVAIRGVRVDTGEVRLSGTAQYTLPVNNPEEGILYLTGAATARAGCRIEKGYVWKEDDGISFGGCVKPNDGE